MLFNEWAWSVITEKWILDSNRSNENQRLGKYNEEEAMTTRDKRSWSATEIRDGFQRKTNTMKP